MPPSTGSAPSKFRRGFYIPWSRSATLALLSANALPRMEALRAGVHLIELNQIEPFEDHYIDSLSL